MLGQNNFGNKIHTINLKNYRLETKFQVLQQMDQFIRYYFVYCCYVSNELCHCTYYSGLYCITLCFHQIKKTWCKLGFIYTISTFHHSTQICPISDKSWRSCQKFQVQCHLCAQMLSWLEFQLKGNPWLFSCSATANFRTI